MTTSYLSNSFPINKPTGPHQKQHHPALKQSQSWIVALLEKPAVHRIRNCTNINGALRHLRAAAQPYSSLHQWYALMVQIDASECILVCCECSMEIVQLNSLYKPPPASTTSIARFQIKRTRRIWLELLQVTGKIVMRLPNIHILVPQNTN